MLSSMMAFGWQIMTALPGCCSPQAMGRREAILHPEIARRIVRLTDFS